MSSPILVGFVGNSCTGKTTCMFRLLAHLKSRKLLVGFCADAARFITFDPEKFDTNPTAREYVLWRQLANETEQLARDDVDYILTERTTMDWLLYYEWTCHNIGQRPNKKIHDLALDHLRYDVLFLMSDKGMPYVDDGFRPASTQIRDEVSEPYRTLFRELTDRRAGERATCLVQESSVDARSGRVLKFMESWLELGHLVERPSRQGLYGGDFPRTYVT